MRPVKKLIDPVLAFLVLAFTLLLNCSKSETEDEVIIDAKVVSVEVLGDSMFAYGLPSQRHQLRAIARNSGLSDLGLNRFTWSSSNTEVALINQNGLVEPVGQGHTVISATVDEVTGTFELELKLKEKEALVSGGTLALTHVKLITMASEEVLDDQVVIVKDGMIESYGPSSTMAVPAEATEINLDGKYLMPGMADMHTHLGTNVTESGSGENNELWDLTSKGQLLSLAANGVTTVLNCGDFNDPVNRWKNELARNEYPGPTMYNAKWPRGPLDGYGGGRDLGSVQDAIDFVRVSQAEGYDFIKLYNQTPQFAIEPLIEEAQNRGMGTVGHFPTTSTPAATLRSGLDLVAHSEAFLWSYFQFQVNDALIPGAVRLNLDNDNYVITTLGVVKSITEVWCNNRPAVQELYSNDWMDYVHRPTSVQIWDWGIEGARWNPAGCTIGQRDREYDFVKRYVKAFYDAGVPLLIGSDSPTVLGAAGFSMHLEFEILQEMGISNFEILKMATVNAGVFINNKLYEPFPFGMVQEGYRADLMVLDNNPLEDLENLKRPYGVLLRGNWYTRDFFDAKLEALKQAYGN